MDSFIDKGADVKSNKDKIFKNVLIRMPTSVLDELDECLKMKPWVNRTQWIVEAIHEKLRSKSSEESKENSGGGN